MSHAAAVFKDIYVCVLLFSRIIIFITTHSLQYQYDYHVYLSTLLIRIQETASRYLSDADLINRMDWTRDKVRLLGAPYLRTYTRTYLHTEHVHGVKGVDCTVQRLW